MDRHSRGDPQTEWPDPFLTQLSHGMIGIIDYGMGNLRSVQKALERLGRSVRILHAPEELGTCRGVILPGVGAFRDAIAELRRQGLEQAIREYATTGRPLLGICLGQQLLFETSYEDGTHSGLGLIAGEVVRFRPEPGLKIPHMGWNALSACRSHPLLEGCGANPYVYFVHSYYVQPVDTHVIVATSQHGGQPFAAIVAQENVMATQFHPEKSQQVGLRLLENFANLVEAPVRN